MTYLAELDGNVKRGVPSVITLVDVCPCVDQESCCLTIAVGCSYVQLCVCAKKIPVKETVTVPGMRVWEWGMSFSNCVWESGNEFSSLTHE